MAPSMRQSSPQLNVLLASGNLAAASGLHGESLLALNFRTRELQATVVTVVLDGEGLRLDFGSGFAIFADVPDLELLGRDCCVMPLEVLHTLPRDGARVLSKGSLCHAYGECVPCKFHCTDRGCKEGVLCGLCHFPHAELTRAAKRAMLRRKGLESCCDYKGFVRPVFHGFIETLCTSMTLPQGPAEEDEDMCPVFLKNTFLHFGQHNHPINAKRSSSVPRKLHASPKAAPAHQPEHELMYIVSTMPRC